MLIKLNKISKTFGEGIKEVKALKNINLEIETGAFTAVSGPSGVER